MDSELTIVERQALGVVTFVLCAAPVLVLCWLFVSGVFGLSQPGWATKVALVVFIVSAALQFPVFLILGGASRRGEISPSVFRTRFTHPFSLFTFWWRHIRPRS